MLEQIETDQMECLICPVSINNKQSKILYLTQHLKDQHQKKPNLNINQKQFVQQECAQCNQSKIQQNKIDINEHIQDQHQKQNKIHSPNKLISKQPELISIIQSENTDNQKINNEIDKINIEEKKDQDLQLDNTEKQENEKLKLSLKEKPIIEKKKERNNYEKDLQIENEQIEIKNELKFDQNWNVSIQNQQKQTSKDESIDCNIDSLKIIFEDFQDIFISIKENIQNISDVMIDQGRPPKQFSLEKKIEILLPKKVEDIHSLIKRLPKEDKLNRICLDNSLHRISLMKNNLGDPYALTIRIGRDMKDFTQLINDQFRGNKNQSILLIAPPGLGKTTHAREYARLKSENNNVVIIDTSNEIAGGGDKPHDSIGEARRMMVHDIDKQFEVMQECVRNHNPEIIVVDEIANMKEAKALESIKKRGVHILGCVHGTFIDLIGNKNLNSLLGEFKEVIYSDKFIESKQLDKQKLKKQQIKRINEPVFDVVIELTIEREYNIISQVKENIDKFLTQDQQDYDHRYIKDNIPYSERKTQSEDLEN